MTVDYQKVWQTMNDLEMVTSKICSARANIDVAIDKLQEHQYDKAEILMNAAYEFLEYYLQEFDDKFKLAWQATVGDLRDGDVKKESWNSFWESYHPKESQQYTEEELNAMCDKAASDEEKEQCREYNLREAEYYDKRVKLDAEVERIRQEGGYEWTPPVENPFTTDIGTVAQNGVSYQEYRKAQIEANSSWNDGWTKEYYQKIVDKYEGKKTLNYDEAVAAGWTMTDDGFWMPPQDKKKWVLPVEEAKDVDTDETEYFISLPQDLLETAKLKEGDEIKWVDNGNGSYTIVKVTKPLGPDEC